MNDAIITIEDRSLGFFLCWMGGPQFAVYKQNGQKLGEWTLDREPTQEEARQELTDRRDNGDYLNIIE